MKKPAATLLLLALAGFGYGLYHLFQLRFAAGDSYPAYSSLRADPLGSKAFFESLEPLVETSRHFRSLPRLGEGAQTTVFLLGLPAETLSFPPSDWAALETFVRSGGRLVLALFPAYQQRWASPFPAAGLRRPFPPVAGTNRPSGRPDRFAEVQPIRLVDRWSVRFEYAALERDGQGTYRPARAQRRQAPPSLPDDLAVHTACYFAGLDPVWRVLYARPGPTNDLPVVMERAMGRGTVVLAADSFLLSNEALRHEPNAALLAWLVGPNQRVLFDETHLGVEVEPGLVALARQYRLGGFFVTLLVLAGLFVWKNATSFLPPYETGLAREPDQLIEGRDSASGFINLLRRHLPPSELMKTCLEEWNSDGRAAGRPEPARLEAMQRRIDTENAREPGQRDPVVLYRDLAGILSRRRPSPAPSSRPSARTEPITA